VTKAQRPATTNDADILVESDEHSLTVGPDGPVVQHDHYLNGYSSHTYLWVSAEGRKHWVKYHFITDQGIEFFISDVPGWAVPLVRSCRAAGEDIDCALDLADRYGRLLRLPGHGQTARRWAVLAAVAEQNLTVARVLEAHSNALAILAEAERRRPAGPGGVRRGGPAAPADRDPVRAEGPGWPGCPDRGQAVVLAGRAAGLRAGHRARSWRAAGVPGQPA
jgi:hypothetical protein